MTQKLVYLVQRYEMPMDGPGIYNFPECIFETAEKAKEYCLKQDPEDKGFEYTWPVWIDDIVSGVARLDWYGDKPDQIPLSTTQIIKCFLFLDEISTDTVIELLDIKKSQASLYVKACTLSYRFLKKSLEHKAITSMKYPRQSIVCEQQGIDLGYLEQNKIYI